LGRGFSFIFQNLQAEIARESPYYGNSSILNVIQDVNERSYLGYYGAWSQLREGRSAVGSVDGYLFLNDTWRLRFQAATANQSLEAHDAAPSREGDGYLGAASLIYSLYPFDFQLSYTAITEDFDPLLGYIPRRDIFGPTLLASYTRKSGDNWYKDYGFTYYPRYYQNADGRTTLRDHDLYGYLLLRNDLRLRAGYLNEFHDPHHNHRVTIGTDIFASDYYKAFNLTYATGEFERVDYREIAFAKRIKFWERFPIREELVLRFEDRPDNTSEIVWLNRIVFDLFIRDNSWLKGSIQIRDHHVHNYSLIYGWEFQKRAWLYLVYNDVKSDSPDSGRSIFAKITYTF
jgi:hypothetical protein